MKETEPDMTTETGDMTTETGVLPEIIEVEGASVDHALPPDTETTGVFQTRGFAHHRSHSVYLTFLRLTRSDLFKNDVY